MPHEQYPAVVMAYDGQEYKPAQGLHGAVRSAGSAILYGVATGGDNSNLYGDHVDYDVAALFVPNLLAIVRLEHDGVLYIRKLAGYWSDRKGHLGFNPLPEGISVRAGDRYDLLVMPVVPMV